jgi:hypothetical protein
MSGLFELTLFGVGDGGLWANTSWSEEWVIKHGEDRITGWEDYAPIEEAPFDDFDEDRLDYDETLSPPDVRGTYAFYFAGDLTYLVGETLTFHWPEPFVIGWNYIPINVTLSYTPDSTGETGVLFMEQTEVTDGYIIEPLTCSFVWTIGTAVSEPVWQDLRSTVQTFRAR